MNQTYHLLFENRLVELQDQIGLQPFQSRILVKWFRTASQFGPLVESRELFTENICAYFQRLGEPQIHSARSDPHTRKIDQVLPELYSHKQLNEIYYLAIRAFDEIYSMRKSYYRWIDSAYDQKLISAGAALRIQALIQRALPFLLQDSHKCSRASAQKFLEPFRRQSSYNRRSETELYCPNALSHSKRHREFLSRSASQDSIEQLASSGLSDSSDTVLFTWLERYVQKTSARSALPKIPLSWSEIDLLVQISLVVSKMDPLIQNEINKNFVENLISSLDPGLSQRVNLSHLMKKMLVYKYWLLRICDEMSNRRHLFASTLDGLLDNGFLEYEAADAILELFEEFKNWNRSERVERFIQGLENIQKKGVRSIDIVLLSQIFLVTRF